ncbi:MULTISPECIES: hypothetical protein [Bacillus]|uniref:hypothetical protein n=1 Tax=Bacillus TaxID=1386 RepID=UPI000C24E197|nr:MULTISPECIES: hypothetical protein [Bacillus]MDN0040378.1 hypothetical protein [Bacillus aerophilus]MCP9283061.1 hypothetical protein [Bacillus safensis]MED0864140.1 hypothetical protein [Bacillus safensis]PJI14016.1 hypothetical protein CTV96_02710 [Bacillus altitudinis]PKQ86665.1 hypothetical protein CTV98_000670 [Bacillus altitudinis]
MTNGENNTVINIGFQIENMADREIEQNLAGINTRIENIIKYGRFDDSEAKNKPEYFSFKLIENNYKSLTEGYTTSSVSNDLNVKATTICGIYMINNKLEELERGFKDGEK